MGPLGARAARATFENSIGELELDGSSARVTLRRSPREDEEGDALVVVHRTDLTVDQDESAGLAFRAQQLG